MEIGKLYKSFIRNGNGSTTIRLTFNEGNTFDGNYQSRWMGIEPLNFDFIGDFVCMPSPNHIMMNVRSIGDEEGYYHFDGFFINSDTYPASGEAGDKIYPHMCEFTEEFTFALCASSFYLKTVDEPFATYAKELDGARFA